MKLNYFGFYFKTTELKRIYVCMIERDREK